MISTNKKNQPQYWLKSSAFVGNFYDDDQIKLIDIKPFSTIDEATTVDGFQLLPPPPSHIIPAGTLVKIVSISHPTLQEKLKRPLYSPRSNIWVLFQVAKERGRVNIFNPELHILIIPQALKSDEQIKSYLARYLSTHNPNQWILKEPSHIQQAIWQKHPIVGMNKDQIEACLGSPLKKQFIKESNKNDIQELWHFDDYFIFFDKEKVIKISSLKNMAKMNENKNALTNFQQASNS